MTMRGAQVHQHFAQRADQVADMALVDDVTVVLFVVGFRTAAASRSSRAVGLDQGDAGQLLLDVAEDQAEMPVHAVAGIADTRVEESEGRAVAGA